MLKGTIKLKEKAFGVTDFNICPFFLLSGNFYQNTCKSTAKLYFLVKEDVATSLFLNYSFQLPLLFHLLIFIISFAVINAGTFQLITKGISRQKTYGSAK